MDSTYLNPQYAAQYLNNSLYQYLPNLDGLERLAGSIYYFFGTSDLSQVNTSSFNFTNFTKYLGVLGQ